METDSDDNQQESTSSFILRDVDAADNVSVMSCATSVEVEEYNKQTRIHSMAQNLKALGQGGSGRNVDEEAKRLRNMICKDDEKTKEVRRHYRKLLRDTREERDELLQPDNESLCQKVDEANECFKYVKSPREGVLDSKFMTLAVEIGSKKTKMVDTNYVSFDYKTYVDKVNKHMEVALKDMTLDTPEAMERAFWEEFDCMTNNSWKSIVPTIKPILGALEDVEEKRQRQTRRDDTKLSERGKLLQPEKVSGDMKAKGEHAKEATPAEIEKILSIIKGLYQQEPQPIDYFELVLHPTDFGRTVMNIFHLSFLVKDGYVRLFLDERQLPVLEPRQPNASEAAGSSSSSTSASSSSGEQHDGCNQMAVSISKAEWREAVKAFQLEGKEPLIP